MKTVLLLASALLLGGCGGSGTVIHHGTEQPSALPGEEVAAMAEEQLEAAHPRMARGTMTCPDLDFVVGASVRCVRRTELSGGRVVRIGGTVEVTSRENKGRLRVSLDRTPIGFGLNGAAVAKEVARRLGLRSVRCPSLPGRVGATATCSASKRSVRLRVTGVDEHEYSLAFVAR